ncbi:MAG: tRNA (adenosine(37)-N6)-threonylcarbamoyltransferase complex transferase subunit TsaD, partial [Atribacterota bacterium]
MDILSIETSCDDTCVAVVRDGKTIRSNIVSSQDDFHRRFGGVVPEVASRKHLEFLIPVLDEACSEAQVSLSDIDGIVAPRGP